MTEVNLGDIFWKLGIKSTIDKDVSTAEGKVNKLGESEKKAEAKTKAMSKTFLKAGVALTGTGIAAKVMSDNINNAYLPFDTAMAEVKSLGGLTEKQFESMEESAISLSKELPISAAEVASGMYMMRSAGYDASKTLAEMPAIADMAVAGNLDMADAVNATTAVLDSYGTKAGDAGHITDVLMGTVQAFKTTLPELQNELSKNIGVAANLGISFEELAAMNGMLKKDFVNSEEAGTAMKSMLLKLTDPSNEVKFAKLGMSVKDSSGNFVGMETVLDQLSGKVASAGGNVEQMALLTDLFGQEGLRAAMSLIRQKDELSGYTDQLSAGGQVQEALNAVLESTESKLDIATNKMDAAKIAMGDSMAPATLITADAMSLFAGVVEGLPGPLQTTVGMGLQMSQAFIGIGPLMMGIGPAMTAFSALQTGTLVPSLMASAAAGWAFMAPWLPIIAAIAAVIVVGYLLYTNWDTIVAGLTKLFEYLMKVIKDIWPKIVGVVTKAVDFLWDLFISFTPLGFIIGHFDEILDFLTSLGKTFYEAGANLIQFLVDGIKSLIMKPYELVSDAIGFVADLLPHSPAKIGPLSKMPNWDAYFVDPISSVTPSIKQAATDATKSVANVYDSVSNMRSNQYDNSIQIDQMTFNKGADVDEFWKLRDDRIKQNRIQKGIRS
jgi:TP901 family phage tail tape measure protein